MIAALICIPLLFWRLGGPALIEPDEGRYAVAALEMIDRGEYVIPYLDGEPRLNKPPLAYWAIMGSYRLFGVSEFAARFPSAAAGLVSLVSVYLVARRLHGAPWAYWAVPLLFSMPLFAGTARLATPDSLMTGLLAAAMYFWLELTRSPGKWPWLAAVWASTAFAFLAKGPAAPLIFLLAVLLFCAITKQSRLLARTLHPAGLMVFAAIAMPWPVVAARRVDGALALWWSESFRRYVVGIDHGGHPLFPLGAFLAGTLPWCLALFPWQLGRPSVLWQRLKRDEALLFPACFAAAAMVFFSLSRSQLATYVLPALPAAAVACAGRIKSCLEQPRLAVRLSVSVLVAEAALWVAALVYGFVAGEIPAGPATLIACAVAAAVIAAILVRNRLPASLALLSVGAFVAASAAFGGPLILTKVGEHRSFRDMVQQSSGVLSRAQDVLFCGPTRYTVVFYSERLDRRSVRMPEAVKALADSPGAAVIMRREAWTDSLQSDSGDFVVVARQTMAGNEYVLVAQRDL